MWARMGSVDVRQHCSPDVTPRYAGYSAWRALIAERAFADRRASRTFRVHEFGLPPGEQFLGYPVAGPDNDLRPAAAVQCRVVSTRDEATKLKWLLTDEHGVTHTISIPPPLIRREAIAEMRADAERLVAPQFRQIVRLIQEPILQPIYDLESPHMRLAVWANLGDAAFRCPSARRGRESRKRQMTPPRWPTLCRMKTCRAGTRTL